MVLPNVNTEYDDTGSWIVFFITVILPVIFVTGIFALLYYKKKKASILVRKFAKQDPLWNEEYLKEYTRNMFIRVNQSWLEMNFREIMPFLTDKLKMEWISIIKIMQQNELIYGFSSVDIEKLEIIGAIDDVDNNRDVVQIRISGYMRRHFRNIHTNQLTKKSSPGYDFFADMYTYKRADDTWMLDEIEYLAGFSSVMRSTISNFNNR